MTLTFKKTAKVEPHLYKTYVLDLYCGKSRVSFCVVELKQCYFDFTFASCCSDAEGVHMCLSLTERRRVGWVRRTTGIHGHKTNLIYLTLKVTTNSRQKTTLYMDLFVLRVSYLALLKCVKLCKNCQIASFHCLIDLYI